MSSNPSRQRRSTTRLAVLIRLVVLAVAASALSMVAPPTQAAAELSAADKIKPQLAQQLESKGEASFWVRFAQADLSSASQIKDWNERGQAVYDALTAAADASQKEALARARRRGRDVPGLLGTNAIRVDAGDEALVDRLAGLTRCSRCGRPATTRSRSRSRARTSRTSTRSSGASPTSTPTTSGTSTASPARASSSPASTPACSSTTRRWSNQYRGNNGDGTFDHNYNWFDAAGSCADRARATPTATARTRWARWSATTAPPTRSASRPARSGSPPTAAAPPTRR